ncbi:MAG: hypothetical protein ACFCUI_12825 [Bernardetiaceae bacterium]
MLPPEIDFAAQYNIPILTVIDTTQQIATACGIYATPQATLLTPDGKVFYRGNDNVSRYCTDRQTNFAEQALMAYLDGKNPPDFGHQALQAYGCAIE